MGIVGLCSDHAGFELKEYIKTILDKRGLSYKDFGTYSSDSCDYPDFAHLMGKAVEAGEVYPGIAVCGTGNGISMTLNKHRMSLPEFRKKAELNMKGSAGQKRVPANFLAKFEISLPPIGLQKVYIDFFNQIDKSKLIIQKALEDLVGKV